MERVPALASSPQGHAAEYFARAEQALASANIERAASLWGQAAVLARRAGDLYLATDALLELAACLVSLGRFNRLAAIAERLLELEALPGLPPGGSLSLRVFAFMVRNAESAILPLVLLLSERRRSRSTKAQGDAHLENTRWRLTADGRNLVRRFETRSSPESLAVVRRFAALGQHSGCAPLCVASEHQVSVWVPAIDAGFDLIREASASDEDVT